MVERREEERSVKSGLFCKNYELKTEIFCFILGFYACSAKINWSYDYYDITDITFWYYNIHNFPFAKYFSNYLENSR